MYELKNSSQNNYPTVKYSLIEGEVVAREKKISLTEIY